MHGLRTYILIGKENGRSSIRSPLAPRAINKTTVKKILALVCFEYRAKGAHYQILISLSQWECRTEDTVDRKQSFASETGFPIKPNIGTCKRR